MCNTAAARRRCRGFLPFLAVLLTLGSLSGSRLLAASDSTYGQIPLTFTANRGQIDDSVRFTVRWTELNGVFHAGIFAGVANNANVLAGWQTMGSWTVN